MNNDDFMSCIKALNESSTVEIMEKMHQIYSNITVLSAEEVCAAANTIKSIAQLKVFDNEAQDLIYDLGKALVARALFIFHSARDYPDKNNAISMALFSMFKVVFGDYFGNGKFVSLCFKS